MISLAPTALALLVVFGISVLIERTLRRSRKEMRNPGWLLVFFALFLPAVGIVYATVPVESAYLYAAYALAGGSAALVAQCFYGARLPDI